MATQRIIVAKIGGKAGLAAMQSLHDLRSSLNIVHDSNRHTSRRSGHPQALKAFAASLRLNGAVPPVIFFEEYVDMWSMGDFFERCLPRRRIPNIAKVVHGEFEVWGYRLPDGGLLERQTKRLLRSKPAREPSGQEQRWFLSSLLHALDAWDSVAGDAALIIVREVLGALLGDSEVKQAMEHVPQWVTLDP
jgi:hypothetical protein